MHASQQVVMCATDQVGRWSSVPHHAVGGGFPGGTNPATRDPASLPHGSCEM